MKLRLEIGDYKYKCLYVKRVHLYYTPIPIPIYSHELTQTATCIHINLHSHTHKETYSLCVFEVHLFGFHGCMCVVLYALVLVYTNTHMYNLNHIYFLLPFSSTIWLLYINTYIHLYIHMYINKHRSHCNLRL